MATIGFSEMNPSQNLKAKKQHEQKLKNRWIETKGLSQISLQGFEFGVPGVHQYILEIKYVQVANRNHIRGRDLEFLNTPYSFGEYLNRIVEGLYSCEWDYRKILLELLGKSNQNHMNIMRFILVIYGLKFCDLRGFLWVRAILIS
jgi:hypothetical protein